MSCTVIVGHNPLDRDSWQRHEQVPDLLKFLLEDFGPFYGGRFPSSARIYLESIDGDHDITPANELAAKALSRVAGTVYVMVWPKDPGTILVSFALFVVPMVIRGLLGDDRLKAGGSKAVAKTLPSGSPNNIAGERRNSARVNERIPDIYGRVRSTPDLLMAPYIIYRNNLQQEVSYMCIGQGEYEIDEDEVFEGDTRVNQLADTSIQIYGPGQAPGGGTPQLTIGQAITDSIYNVVPVDSVKGDILLPLNGNALYSDDLFHWNRAGDPDKPRVAQAGTSPFNEATSFTYPFAGVGVITYRIINLAVLTTQSDITNLFSVGMKVGLEWSTKAVSVHPTELQEGDGGAGNRPNLRLVPEIPEDEHYTITSIDTSAPEAVSITLSVPASMQPEWEKLIVYNPSGELGLSDAGEVYNLASILYPVNTRQGPYFVNDPNMEFIQLNFAAPNGLFQDDGKTQVAFGKTDTDPGGVEVVIEVTPADANGVASGTKEVFTHTIHGSSSSRDFIGETVIVTPTFGGRFLLGVYRNTLTVNRHNSQSWETYNRQFIEENLLDRPVLAPWDGVTESRQFTGNCQDEVRWTHAYSMSEVPNISFGGITTVHAKVVQRKNQRPDEADRRLNMIVTRVIPEWNGTGFDPAGATRSGRDALFSILRLTHLGNVPDSQIDFDSIASARDDVVDSLGDLGMFNFDHTFDGSNTSLEDMITAVAESCFISVYREGDIIKASPDISTQDSTLLFNHRNKIPGSEIRSVTWGTPEDYDGVTIEYHDDTDERIKSYTIPTEGAALNPKKIELAGIHLRKKAILHAWRAYNELIHKNSYVEFDALEESLIGLVNDRIMVADNTRIETQDGDIVAVDGLTLTTSQQAIMAGPSTVFIQHVDGSTEAIAVSTQSHPNEIVLASAPSQTLLVDHDNGLYPRYMLVPNSRTTSSAFRILDRSFKSQGVFTVTGYNYSEAYYFNDALVLWLPFKSISGFPTVNQLDDRSPYELDIQSPNGAGTTTDSIRGQVYDGSEVGDHLLAGNIIFSSYTIACWINRTSAANPAYVISSNGTNDLLFLLEGTSNIAKGIHGGVTYVEVEFDLNEWTHLALTYDSNTDVMTIFKDGEVADTATSVPGHGLLVVDTVIFANTPFADGLVGRADDLRLYNRAKHPDFIRTLYQKTRVVT